MSAWNGGPSKRYDLSPLVFVLVPHLEDRWRERIGEPWDRERIQQEVFHNWFNGRWSRDAPAWLRRPDLLERPPRYYYLWPASRAYVYVVRVNMREFLVRTVLTPE